MRVCIYPGTFDPVTNGHMDIILRAAALFDKMVIGIANDNYKTCLFSKEERIETLKEVTADLNNVEVEAFSGLLMEFCKAKNACAVIRGLRAVSDFEYEMQLALMNKKLNPNVETVFLMTGQQHSFISSSIIKDVAVLGGCIRDLVPPSVEKRIIEKYRTV
ncbi:MAG TPA: pantetheine-phosphate adenylyltransferase [Clostridiales bacterium]|nr:pantetheine-phosphate adenylyltransferase [Clostridiales bacterium]